MPSIPRREFLQQCGAIASLALLQDRQEPVRGDELPPVRAITKGPKFHWFGYYDKLEFDPTSRYCLGMATDFEHRTPKPDDEIGIGMIDVRDGDKYIELGKSRAWCWQQGCMLQWRPGSKTEVVWNDREDDAFVSHIVDVKTHKRRTLPRPIYTLSPDGKTAMSVDFARVQAMRPGYGYVGSRDTHAGELAPESSGIFRLDLETGHSDLVVPLAKIAAHAPGGLDFEGAKHYFNHLLFSPDGTRFILLHRWRPNGGRGGFRTRMLTARADGTDLRVVDGSGYTSHFIWRDSRHILAWTRVGKKDGFWLFEDADDARSPRAIGRGVMTRNGHCTYLPGNEWILNDTYPDRHRRQHPYLFHVKTGRRVALGHFLSPVQYRGEWRCDNHPRFSPDGRSVVIDSPHGGHGRQLWLIDVSGIVG